MALLFGTIPFVISLNMNDFLIVLEFSWGVKTFCYLSNHQLQDEKEKAAARIDGLENEIDGLKSRLRKLQDKADREVIFWLFIYKAAVS